MNVQNKLLWDDKYKVGVEVLDAQHKKLFEIINELLDAISHLPNKENVENITKHLIEYKKTHFETEEKLFKDCNYEKTEQHIAIHHEFSDKLDSLQKEYGDDPIVYAFQLVDYLEDWMIKHLMNSDKDYTKCLHDHGVK